MATGDAVGFVRPQQFTRDGGLGSDLALSVSNHLVGALLDRAGDAVYFEDRVPTNGTPLSTGLTFQVSVASDPVNPSPGKNVRVGVAVKRVPSGGDEGATAFGTEVVATVALDAGINNITLANIAQPNANLGSLAAGDRYLARVRRVPGDALDTCPNRCLLFGVSIRDT